jgi:hypothetical protein
MVRDCKSAAEARKPHPRALRFTAPAADHADHEPGKPAVVAGGLGLGLVDNG